MLAGLLQGWRPYPEGYVVNIHFMWRIRVKNHASNRIILRYGIVGLILNHCPIGRMLILISAPVTGTIIIVAAFEVLTPILKAMKGSEKWTGISLI
jgi:hypothetical protein